MVTDDKIKALMAVFSRLPQRVIMKWDTKDIEGKSDNVILGKWFPQNDILAHPNVKLFISHCGLGSIVESKYHGVPILGFPMFADQFMNAKLAAGEGWLLVMDLKTLEENEFESTIKQLMYNDT